MILLWSLWSACERSEPPPGTLMLGYTQNVSGEIEPCG